MEFKFREMARAMLKLQQMFEMCWMSTFGCKTQIHLRARARLLSFTSYALYTHLKTWKIYVCLRQSQTFI